MPFVTWSSDYDLPHPLINAQHKSLFDALNALAAALGEDSEADPTDTFIFLVNYTAEHFADEERLMEEASYPDLDAHRAQHRALVQDVETRLQAFMLDGDATGLLDFLRDWLVVHIGGSDRKLASYLVDRA